MLYARCTFVMPIHQFDRIRFHNHLMATIKRINSFNNILFDFLWQRIYRKFYQFYFLETTTTANLCISSEVAYKVPSTCRSDKFSSKLSNGSLTVRFSFSFVCGQHFFLFRLLSAKHTQYKKNSHPSYTRRRDNF